MSDEKRAGGSVSISYVGPAVVTEEDKADAEAPAAPKKPEAKKAQPLKEVIGDQKSDSPVLLKEEK